MSPKDLYPVFLHKRPKISLPIVKKKSPESYEAVVYNTYNTSNRQKETEVRVEKKEAIYKSDDCSPCRQYDSRKCIFRRRYADGTCRR